MKTQVRSRKSGMCSTFQHEAVLTSGELERVTGGTLSLNFTKIEVVYVPQTDDGADAKVRSGK